MIFLIFTLAKFDVGMVCKFIFQVLSGALFTKKFYLIVLIMKTRLLFLIGKPQTIH